MEKSRSVQARAVMRARSAELRSLVGSWNGAVAALERAVVHQKRLEDRLEARITRLTGLSARQRAHAQRLLDDHGWPRYVSLDHASRLLACRDRLAAIEADMAPELGNAAQRVEDARSVLKAASRALLSATGPTEVEGLVGRSRRSLAHETGVSTTPKRARSPGKSGG
jgi:hypothetical protein